ncbi:MAG TPA: HAMP domain-containing protein, partial [Polyangiaceae bacterium]
MANSAALRRRTVARRVLLSYVMVMTAFALVAGWSATSLRRAAHELELMRSGYLPLALALHDLVAIQNNWNTQLNHITTAKNPTDIRVWMEFARVGRLKEFSGVRDAIAHAFIASGDESTRRIGGELLAKTASIQHFAAADGERLGRLFLALEQRDPALAERLRDDLTRRGIESKRRLDELERQVRRNVAGLHDQARNREKLATRLLFALAVLTLLVGVVMALYTQRVLQPLGRVTERAKAVARGDLTPRPVVATNDEIGELATTF